ncbi:CheB methylesterase domain-containing protein [Acetobacterium woodii]|uniref:protein-glutamate methylesterase n=1 Tax=Acetobacterium woodii (strain ATCC 29683 / DSM 1030 / JCM 2381 / KCTC 1655 / WB1) TaxID=931626 RepID=H6LJ83_ACEWD|nr:CheB methylesterase domain-containing protein [Acetobacterium woodii]AFA48646.1 chemotaxis-specific methylesterase CheB2 [Acetobacterium woodii DSM 1030]
MIKNKPKPDFTPELLVLAASTGGPVALEVIIGALKKDFAIPIVVVQHMPKHFTAAFAKALNRKSELLVKEAQDGDELTAGIVYLAPGGCHLKLSHKRKLTLTLSDDALINGVRPAVDVLLWSIAQSRFINGILVVILTGMGADGLVGLQQLHKNKQAYCIVQDEVSSIVYGMPQRIVEAELADEILPLSMIAARLSVLVRKE